MCVCAHDCSCPQRPAKGEGNPGCEVIGSCKHLVWVLRSDLRSSRGQQVLFSSKLSF